jgi:hypothetical protein
MQGVRRARGTAPAAHPQLATRAPEAARSDATTRQIGVRRGRKPHFQREKRFISLYGRSTIRAARWLMRKEIHAISSRLRHINNTLME